MHLGHCIAIVYPLEIKNMLLVKSYPLVMTFTVCYGFSMALIEIDGLPFLTMVIFNSYVSHYQRVPFVRKGKNATNDHGYHGTSPQRTTSKICLCISIIKSLLLCLYLFKYLLFFFFLNNILFIYLGIYLFLDFLLSFFVYIYTLSMFLKK